MDWNSMTMTTSSYQDISKCEMNKLIERVEHAIEHDLALNTEDMKLLLKAVQTLLEVHDRMEDDDITLKKLKKLLGMVKSSESRRSKTGKQGNGNQGDKKGSSGRKKSGGTKPNPPEVIHHKSDYQKGQKCPECACGKLYKNIAPGTLLRITGHAPFEATKHITEKFRCNTCEAIFEADLPEAVLEDGHADQMYGYSARSLIAVNKFYTGTPYYHQGNLSSMMGCTVSATTAFEQCQYVANDIAPVIDALKRQAAQAVNIDIDDTRNKILEQKPEYRENRNGKGKRLRTGVYTSGLIAKTKEGHEIVLFETSLGHAGEHLDAILEEREDASSKPLIMSDALSSNASKHAVEKTYCNAHCRRNFFDLSEHYPKEIDWVLEQYAKIWQNDSQSKEQSMTADERLVYHKEHSWPVMESLRGWAQKHHDRVDFEEHSSFGKAVKYLLKHYDNLTKFCKIQGAKIDNNRMEERLKLVIRGRKTSHFYKTVNGADVANKLQSLISTADTAGVNVFDYLCALQRYRVKVRENPGAWLPWTFEKALNELKEPYKPDKRLRLFRAITTQ
jgi:transposase